MYRNQINEMAVFAAVAQHHGFRAAAQELKLTPAAVSEAIQRFENKLGVRLFDRSTRAVSLTGPGEFLFRHCQEPLRQLEEILLQVRDQAQTLSGTLTITAPQRAGQFFLDKLIIDYVKQFPDVKVELFYDDRKVDLAAAGVDIAIRSQTLLDEHTHAFPISPKIPMIVLGSKKYLDERGEPKHPNDLVNHDGICFARGNAEHLVSWEFKSAAGLYSVMPKPRIIVNDFPSMFAYCEAGLGLCYTLEESDVSLVEQNRLTPILTQHTAVFPPYSINYLSKRHMPRRVRAFLDLAKNSR